MSFTSGTSTSPSNLLSTVNTFLTGTAGWTAIRTNGSPGAQVSFNDAASGLQMNILADDSANTARWDFQPSLGDGGAGVDFYDHTDTPDDTGNAGTFPRFGNGHTCTADQGFSGSSNYWIFADATSASDRYCHVVTTFN